MRRRLGSILVLVGAGLALGSGCGDTNEERIRAATLLEGCLINSDCQAPFVCVFRKCHKQCETTRDCDDGTRCVVGESGLNVCQPDTPCSYNSQCPGSQVCAIDGECRDQCAADRDCVAEQVCVTGVCADTEELDQGELPVVDAGPADGRPCSYNSECELPLACINGLCKIECFQDRDCTYGLVCYLNRCSLPSAVPDGGAADASSGTGGVDASAGANGVGGNAGAGASGLGGASSGGASSGGTGGSGFGGTGGTSGSGGSGGSGQGGSGGTGLAGAGGVSVGGTGGG